MIMTKKETGYMPVGEIVNATKKAFEAFAVLEIGKEIVKNLNAFPGSKCQVCGHKIILLDKKYNKDCKPYLFHNWQKKCFCGCVTPKMKEKEFNYCMKIIKKEKEGV
jgi:hypothetical protein